MSSSCGLTVLTSQLVSIRFSTWRTKTIWLADRSQPTSWRFGGRPLMIRISGVTGQISLWQKSSSDKPRQDVFLAETKKVPRLEYCGRGAATLHVGLG